MLLAPFEASVPACFILPVIDDLLATLEGGVLWLGLEDSPSSETCFPGAGGGIPSCLGLVFGEDSIKGNWRNESCKISEDTNNEVN